MSRKNDGKGLIPLVSANNANAPRPKGGCKSKLYDFPSPVGSKLVILVTRKKGLITNPNPHTLSGKHKKDETDV
jgi:hypothetical protein